MNKVIKNKTKDSIIEIVLELLLGLTFLIWPRDSQNVIVYTLGAVIIALGVIDIVVILTRGFSLPFQIGLDTFLIVMGILLCAFNSWFVSLFPVLIGIYLLVRGIYQTLFSIFVGGRNTTELTVSVIYGVVLIVLGITLMVLRNNVEIIGYFIGVSFLVNALFDGLYLFTLHRNIKKAKDAFSNNPPHSSNKDVIDVDFTEKPSDDDLN
jgi:uncharacterized membrane protein HdeD (DUF308 family)